MGQIKPAFMQVHGRFDPARHCTPHVSQLATVEIGIFREVTAGMHLPQVPSTQLRTFREPGFPLRHLDQGVEVLQTNLIDSHDFPSFRQSGVL
jgi:hypothetical protein